MAAPRTNAGHDQNRIPTLLGVSTTDGITPVPAEVDPATGQLQVAGGGGGTQYQEGLTTSPATGTVAEGRYKVTPPSLTDGQINALQLDSSGNLKVTGSLSVGGTTDNSAFTAGTGTGTPAMGFYHSAIDTVTDGRAAAAAITPKRAVHNNLRDSSGNEINSTSNTTIDGTARQLNVAPVAKSADFYPLYNNSSLGGGQLKSDPSGALITRGAILTDEGTGRSSFTGSAVGFSIGTCTFTNGSTTVTGTGFSTADVHFLDFIKLNADAESAWNEVAYIINDTTIQLFTPYTGTGGTGASSGSQIASSTGTGATISVASGQLTMALGTNTSATTYIYRPAADNFCIAESSFSVSQRVANQDIYFGIETTLSGVTPQFARFHFTSTTNTQVITETGYNPTTTPSASEQETNTITLPGAVNTASAQVYRIEEYPEKILFYINKTLVATHTKRIPHVASQGDNVDFLNLRGTNSGAITNTNVVVDYLYLKNYDRIDTIASTYADSSTSPGTAPSNAIVGAAQYNATEISPTTAQTFAIQADSKGRQRGVIMDGAGNTRAANVDASNRLNTISSIDQTTPGTTNAVSANQGTAAALTAGWPMVNGESADTTGTITTATGNVTASGLIGYANTTVSINGTYAGLVALWEGSDDSGVTYYPITAAREGVPPTLETNITPANNTSQSWQINNPGLDSIRLRATALTSGTVNVRISASASPTASGTVIGVGYALPTGANVIGALTANQSVNVAQINGVTPLMGNGVTGTGSQRVTIASDNTAFSVNAASVIPGTGATNLGKAEDAVHTTGDTGVAIFAIRDDTLNATSGTEGDYELLHTTASGALWVTAIPSTTGGWTPSFNAAVTTTVKTVKGSAGTLGGWFLYNPNATVTYVQIFDISGAVTLGTSVPVISLGIPATAGANVENANGIQFANAIKFACTTTALGLTAPSTGLDCNFWFA